MLGGVNRGGKKKTQHPPTVPLKAAPAEYAFPRLRLAVYQRTADQALRP